MSRTGCRLKFVFAALWIAIESLLILGCGAAEASSKAAQRRVRVNAGEPSLTCLCDNPDLCSFITREYEREFLGFFWPYDQPIDLYDWNHITTLAWVPPHRTGVICAAHAAGVRVLINADDVTQPLADTEARAQWIDRMVDLARTMWYDGINFDYEQPAKMGSELARNYTALVRDTATAFKRLNPHAQIFVDVPWSAFGNDGRDYDYVGLADAADRLFVMSYDLQAQIFGRCAAAANSPLTQVSKGLQSYLDLGVQPSKIILGVAWYGYDYPCEPDATGAAPGPQTDICFIRPVEYRGSPCSDAAGAQRDYKDIMANVLHAGLNTTALMWDPLALSPRCNYVAPDTGQVHQVWFETPESLTIRYRLAIERGLRGVGVWNLGSLEHSSQADEVARAETASMWAAVSAFMRS